MALFKNIRLVIIFILLLVLPSSVMAVTWTAESLISSGDYRDIAVGDLNRDGHPDVVAAKDGGITVKHQGKSWLYGAGGLIGDWRYSFKSYASPPFPDKDLDLVPDSNDDVKNTGTGVISWQSSIPPNSKYTEKWKITCTGVVSGVATFSVEAQYLDNSGVWQNRALGSTTFQTQLTRDVLYSSTAFATYSTDFKKPGVFSYTYTGSYSDAGDSGVSFIVSTLSTGDSRYVNFVAGDSFSFYTIASSTTLTSTGGNVYNSVQIADINKDGNPDILAVSDSGTDVWFGNGMGGWTQKLTNALTAGKVIRAGDFNRDGNVDIAIATTAGIKLYTGDGTGLVGGWAAYSTNLPGAGTYNGLVVGDYNNDGFPDVIAAKTTQLEVYKNKGDGTWDTVINVGSPLSGGRTYKAVAVADLDGDGKLDIVAGISAGSGEAAGISVYYGNGAGTWTVSSSNPAAFDNYNGITIADLNNDGSLDIAGAQNGGGIQVWFGNKAIKTWVAQTSPTVVGGYKAIIAGDVANNGIQSLIAAKNGGVDVISQVNAPYFNSWSTGPTAGGSYQRVEVADIDKDGKLDIVATDNAVGAAVGGIHVFYGDGTRIFAQNVKYPGKDDPALSGTYYGLALGDMNRDGYPDILATSNGIPGGIQIWNYQPGTNSWAAGATGGTLPSTGNYYGVRLADVNSDGYLDIVAGSDSGVKVYTCTWNSGTSTYSCSDKSPTDTGSYYDVVIADFNKDGKTDIAGAGSGGVSIWLGKSDGSGDFSTIPAGNKTALTEYTAVLSGGCTNGASGGAPYAGIASGDIDGDGNADIVAGNNNSCGVQAWFNDGSGKIWRIGYSTEPGPSNGNYVYGGIGFGYPSNSSTYSNIWPVGTGAWTPTADWTLTGSFDMERSPFFAFSVDAGTQTQVSKAFMGYPYSSDGGTIYNVTVVPQSSSTTFHPTDTLDTSIPDVFFFRTSAPGVTFYGSYYGVALADVNHDGYLDVVAASNGSGVGVWFGNGMGGWTPQSSPLGYGDYNGVALADFNMDGYLDVVAGHHISGGIGLEIFLNDVDLVLPTVSSTTPAADASNIPTSDPIAVTFSEAMDRTTLSSSNITVTGSSSGSRTIGLFYDSSTTTLTIDPTLDFFPKETITVTLTTGATDAFGNRLDGNSNGYADGSPTDDYTVTFQTKDTAPANLEATAGDGQVVLNWDKNTENDFKGYFVYRGTISGGPYTKITATPITTITYTDSTVTNDTAYYYVVTALDEVSGYPTDAYGTTGDGNYESGYSNEVNATPTVSKPTITNIDPGDGATGVARTKAIDIIFSRTMDMATVAASQFSVVGSSKGVYTVTASSIDSKTVRLSHAVDFDSLETITVTVKSGANGGLKDTSAPTKVGLAADYVITFTAQYISVAKTIMISATPTTANGDGVSTLTLEAMVQDANGYPVQAGATVTFTTGSGKFSNNTQIITATTDANGKATAVITAPASLQTNVTVTASTVSDLYGTLSASTTVNFKPGPPSSVTISTTPSTIVANGADTTTVKAIVKDSGGNLVKDGLYVTFTTTRGTFPNSTTTSDPVTTSNGEASVLLTAGIASGTATITATVGGVAANYTGLTLTADTAAPTVWSVSPTNSNTNVYVGTNISAVFSENIKTSTLAAANFTVIGSVSGTVTGVITYDSSAKAVTFDPVTDFSDGETVTVTLTTGISDLAGNAMASNYVWSFTAVKPVSQRTPAVVTVSADPVDVPVSVTADDRFSSTTITATVVDQINNPVADGYSVIFTTTKGSFSQTDSNVQTMTVSTSGGLASVTLYSTNVYTRTSGVTVTATCSGINGYTIINFKPGVPEDIEWVAYPSAIAADGISASSIWIKVRDAIAGGTSTGLTATVLTDSSRSWTIDAFKGMKLNPDTTQSAKTYTITGNTATTITVTGNMTGNGFVSGSTYKVTASGTTTSLTSTTLTDTGASWTVDALKGLYLNSKYEIASNTATTITVKYTDLTKVMPVGNSYSIEGDYVKDGLSVTFRTDKGTFLNGTQVSDPVTTSNGWATVTLRSSTTDGDIPIITAILGRLEQKAKPVKFTNIPTSILTAESGNRYVELSWTASTSPNTTGYNVHRSTVSGSGYVKLNDAPVTTTTYLSGNLTNDKKYYYVITEVDANGNASSYSSEVSAVPTFDLTWTKSTSNPSLDVGNPGDWDDMNVGKATVILDGTTYKMWYIGSSYTDPTGKVGYATSTDGITWTKYGTTPVLSQGASGTWDDVEISDCNVILDGATYKMWYTATGDWTVYKIGYATSSDGITWTKDAANPVLSPTSGVWAWDNFRVDRPSVIKDGTTYKMWYKGYDGSTYKIGYATSADGVVWSKSASNPVLSATSGAWDSLYVSAPAVVKDTTDNVFKMWYFGTDGTTAGTGYAVSADGISWNKHVSSPVLTFGSTGAFDDSIVSAPAVWSDNTTFKMWYTGGDGYNQRIGYASTVQDSQPPTISLVSPSSGTTGIAKDANITITFSENMDESTLNASNIVVSGSTSGAIGGLITYDSATNTATFNPDPEFQTLEIITVKVKGYARDLAGNTLDGDGDGTAEGSPTDDKTWTFTVRDTLPPSAPTALTATAGSSQVALSWTAPTTNSDGSAISDLQGYNVYRSETSGSGYTKITFATLTSTTYTDTGVTNGTTYYYIVKAVDTSTNESAASSEASATPAANTAPAAPTGLAAVAGNATVALSWTANTETNLAGYNVYRSTVSGSSYSKLNTTLVSATNYTDTGPTNGTIYYYVITAVNSSSLESSYSSQVSATPYTPNAQLGDVDGDSKVTGSDLTALGLAFGSRPASTNWNQYADFDNSGRIDGADLAVLGRYFGKGVTW